MNEDDGEINAGRNFIYLGCTAVVCLVTEN